MEIIDILQQLGVTGISAVFIFLYWQERKRSRELADARIEDYRWWLELMKAARITIIRQDSDSPTDEIERRTSKIERRGQGD